MGKKPKEKQDICEILYSIQKHFPRKETTNINSPGSQSQQKGEPEWQCVAFWAMKR